VVGVCTEGKEKLFSTNSIERRIEERE